MSLLELASQPLPWLEFMMTYSQGHPVVFIGGRFVLDFVNTADWTIDGTVAHEKIADQADLKCWMAQKTLPVTAYNGKIEDLLSFRHGLREILLGRGNPGLLAPMADIRIDDAMDLNQIATDQGLKPLLAASAFSLLFEPESQRRLKMCPSENCGWLFIDETKNQRRKWCRMETCGNRAKAARHYEKSKQKLT